MNNIIRNIFKILPILGIIVFIYVIIDLGISNIILSFSKISLMFIIFALILLFPRILLASYKWFLICKQQKMNIKFFEITRIYLISLFYGIITPSSIGSYISIYYIKNITDSSWEKSITNSLLDVASEFLTGLLFAIIGSVVLLYFIPTLFPILLTLFILCLVIFYLLISDKSRRFLPSIIKVFTPKKLEDRLDKSFDGFYKDIPSIQGMISPFLIDIFIWILIAAQVYIIAIALDIDISFFVFVPLFMISLFAGILPLSVGGLGIREGALVIILSLFGVESNIAFVLSLSGFILHTVVPGLFGVILAYPLKSE